MNEELVLMVFAQYGDYLFVSIQILRVKLYYITFAHGCDGEFDG